MRFGRPTKNAVSAAADVSTHRGAAAGVCVLLAVLVWLVFGQTLRHDFINYDDNLYVYENPVVTAGLTLHGIAWAFTHSVGGNWHPLTIISHMADCQLYGLQPWGHHLTNVLLHGIAAILLFLVLLQMTGAFWRCAFIAAVFAIHPLRAESVAWVAERKDVLSGVFFMLTIGAYIRYCRKPFSIVNYSAVAILFTLGLMCKPMLVTLPALLLVLDYWPLRRFQEKRGERKILFIPWHLVAEKIPLFVLTACSCTATVLAQEKAFGMVDKLSFSGQLGNAVVSYVVYIAQMFYPAKLAILYPHPATSLPLWKVLLSALLLGLVSTGVFLGRKKSPALLAGWLWYLGMLVPVIGFIQVGSQAHADRYTYLPQIGLYIAVAWTAASWQPSFLPRIMPGVAASVAIAALAWLSWVQTSYWRNYESLWNHALSVVPGNSVAYYNLGYDFQKKGRLEEALAHYKKAIEINPGYADAITKLGILLIQMGHEDAGIEQYKKALAAKPDFMPAHYNLGLVFIQKGELPEAIAEFQRAVEITPDDAEAQNSLGAALIKTGRINEAVSHYQKAVELNPGYAAAHYNLGNAFFQTGRIDDAIAQYKKSLDAGPDDAMTHYSLGDALFRKGHPGEAAAHYQKALQLQPDNPGVQNNLAFLMATSPDASLRNGEQAVVLAQKANQSTGGNNPVVLRTLAAAYAEAGRFPDAVETAQRALSLTYPRSDAALAGALKSQLMLYRNNSPFRYSEP